MRIQALRYVDLAQLSPLKGECQIKQSQPYPRHRVAGPRKQVPLKLLPRVLPESIALLARPGSLSLHQSQPCLLQLLSVPRALQTRGHSNGPPQPVP